MTQDSAGTPAPPTPSPTTPSFDRWCSVSGRSIAYRIAQRDLEEINRFEGHLQGLINHAQRAMAINPEEPWLSSLVNYGKTLKARYKVKTVDAKPELQSAANWTRLASLVFTASALELYVRRVVALAVSSDPGLMIGATRAVDGAVRLKRGVVTDVELVVRACTEGVWSARHAALERLFGRLPRIGAVLGDLSKLQATRNAIAHDFARISAAKDFWYLDPGQVQRVEATPITQQRLVSSIKAALVAIDELDGVAIDHIGAFETIRFWHEFTVARTAVRAAVASHYSALHKAGGNAKILSRFHYEMAGNTLSRDYCRDLIAWYDKA